MSLVSELVVQGVRQSLSQSLSKALAGAASGSISNLASRGLLSGLTFNDPGLAAAVSRAQGQLPPSATPPPTPTAPTAPPPPTELAPVTITAPTAPPPAGALGQVIGGNVGRDVLQGGGDAPPPDAAAQDNEVDPVTITGQIPNPANLATVLPAGAAGAALQNMTAPPTELDTLDVVAPRRDTGNDLVPFVPPVVGALTRPPTGPLETPPEEPVTSSDGRDQLAPYILPAVAAGSLLLAPSGDGVTNNGSGGEGGNGGIGGTGITPGDVIAGGILGGGLLGGSGGTGGATDALKDLAGKSAGLADRLGNIATSGFAGDIGGRGLNSINRMVRKAQAAIRQRYAGMGMSGSTAEGQDLQAAADAGVDLQFKVGQEMATAGLNAIAALTGQSASIYTSMLNAATAKNTALGNALANFAGALVR